MSNTGSSDPMQVTPKAESAKPEQPNDLASGVKPNWQATKMSSPKSARATPIIGDTNPAQEELCRNISGSV